ncbi:MAG: hypothetical protein R2713_20280 [Ilumatobacteraceae bacterium]
MVEGTSERNAYIDFLRALSLIVVVLWHWVFTIVLWRDDGRTPPTRSGSPPGCSSPPGCCR